jgi:hypothetical protein
MCEKYYKQTKLVKSTDGEVPEGGHIKDVI